MSIISESPFDVGSGFTVAVVYVIPNGDCVTFSDNK